MEALMVFGGGLGAGLLLIVAINFFVPSNASAAFMHHPSADGSEKKDDGAGEHAEGEEGGDAREVVEGGGGDEDGSKRLRRRATSNASARAKTPQAAAEGAAPDRKFVDDSGKYDADALLALTEEEEKLLRAAARSINPSATDEEIEKEVADARARAKAQVEKEGPIAFTKGGQFRENARAVGNALDVMVVLVVLGVMAYLVKRDYNMEWMDFIAKFLPREIAVLRGEHVAAEE